MINQVYPQKRSVRGKTWYIRRETKFFGFTLVSMCPSVCPSSRPPPPPTPPTRPPSVVRPSVFSFPEDNSSKCQGIFTKLGIFINTVEIWFGIANRHISSNFDGVICPRHVRIFIITWANVNGFWPNLVGALILRSGLELLTGKFHQFLTELSARNSSVFSFSMDFVISMDFPQNLVCALILWRSCLGLPTCNFHRYLTEISARDTSVFSFQDYYLSMSKSQWAFTKLDM